MGKDADRKEAFGGPGIPPRWTHGAKDGVGTAYASSSRLWFTLWNGVVTEVYYPTVDRPQLRDLQFLVTDGESFFHEEKRHLRSTTERLSHHVLGYRITNSDPEGRYSIVKEVLSDPHLPCLLVNTTLSGEEPFLKRLRLYALCAPHLGMGGWGNNASVVDIAGRKILTAEKDGTWLALAATVPFSRLSCGYVGRSDGWTDLAADFRMDWEFDRATDGNIALTGELDLGDRREFTMGLAFGDGLHSAVTTLLESLAVPFGEQRERYTDQWNRSCRHLLPLETAASDGGDLYHGSYSLLLAHEDKTYPGAFIASLSIPWGESKGDDDRGGYHLVWTRDLVNTATGLLAAGNTESPLRALIYLAVSQQADGGFSQNFWIDGEPYWRGIQLDEVAFPILLAWRLQRKGGLGNFDPYPMVMRAARYMILHGPATQQERWEEISGYSPSTIASNIAALVCAASFARERGDGATAAFLEEYADFLECHVEAWMVTTEGTLVPGIPRHYIRILPADVNDPFPAEDPNIGVLALNNRPPGSRWRFPGEGDRRRRVPGARPVRDPEGGRSRHRGLPARAGCRAQGGHAERPVLAAVQPRRIRAESGWRAVHRVWEGARVAPPHRRAGALRVGRRTGSGPVSPGHGGVRFPDRAAAGTGLGRAGPSGSLHVPGTAHRLRHAADVGARRVHQAAPIGGRREGVRPRPRSRGPLSPGQEGLQADGNLEA